MDTDLKRLEVAGWLRMEDTYWQHAEHGEFYLSERTGCWYWKHPQKQHLPKRVGRGYAELGKAVTELLALTTGIRVEAKPSINAQRSMDEKNVLRAEIARLRGILEEYANQTNWTNRTKKGGKIVWIGQGANGRDLAFSALQPQKDKE
jgi:hypothetical protein